MKIKKKEKIKTTGHQWDGIEEYDNPDPFWLRLFLKSAIGAGFGIYSHEALAEPQYIGK